MKVEFSDELVIEGVARAAERLLSSDQFVERIADAVLQRFELLTPDEAAAILQVTKRTLSDNQVEWGLDKSVALGMSNPRYFLSQILDRLHGRKIKGRSNEPERKAA